MRSVILMLVSAALLWGCGEAESKPFEFEENNNLTTGNNQTTGNNSTTGTNNATTGNNQGCVIPEPPEHRAAPETCDNMRPVGSGETNPIEGSECTSDADCVDNMGLVNGRCTLTRGGAVCTYDSCFDDSACGSGVCHCEGGWGADNNVCKSAGNCQVDSDCGPGNYCAPSLGTCGDYGGIEGWYCRTCQDECVSDDDCADNVNGGGRGYCAFDGEKWACANDFCVG